MEAVYRGRRNSSQSPVELWCCCLRLLCSNDARFDAIIHFAGLKAVGESVQKPLILFRRFIGRVSDIICVYQDVNVDELEVKHIVVVHGGGFGAWCWYKTIALLEECKFRVTAIDLTGSGIDLFDTNSVKSLSQYVTPLTDFLEKLADGEKVILVGHDFGGACISYAMELFPSKIAKAIFIAASMLKSGQSTLDMFSLKENTSDLMRLAQKFLYTNGNDLPPTAIDLDKVLLKDLLFNRSPAKIIFLFGSRQRGGKIKKVIWCNSRIHYWSHYVHLAVMVFLAIEQIFMK